MGISWSGGEREGGSKDLGSRMFASEHSEKKKKKSVSGN